MSDEDESAYLIARRKLLDQAIQNGGHASNKPGGVPFCDHTSDSGCQVAQDSGYGEMFRRHKDSETKKLEAMFYLESEEPPRRLK